MHYDLCLNLNLVKAKRQQYSFRGQILLHQFNMLYVYFIQDVTITRNEGKARSPFLKVKVRVLSNLNVNVECRSINKCKNKTRSHRDHAFGDIILR